MEKADRPHAAGCSRRALLRSGASAGVFMLVPIGASACAQNRVSVTDFGDVDPSGKRDSSIAFQKAHDSLPQGGVIEVPAGEYLVAKVDIRHRHITFRLASTATIRKFGFGGVNARAIFIIRDLIDSNFRLEGGSIDLNGEGPRDIGTPGRIKNSYAPVTVKQVPCIAGPTNAAIFALRSSHIYVSTNIANSGESGLLFRNCGDVTVEHCQIENIANYGVEWSYPPPGYDQGSGPMPERARNVVRQCRFRYIDDYGFGTGNGNAIGGGGGGVVDQGALGSHIIEDVDIAFGQSGVNLEFLRGTWIEGAQIRRVTCRNLHKNGMGFVGLRNSVIEDILVENCGGAPAGALAPFFPTLCGVSLSSDINNVTLRRIVVRDNRKQKIITGSDAAISAGSRILRSASARFTTHDIGSPISIMDGNPSGTAIITEIASVQTPRQITLAIPAGQTVCAAKFAYGGATREGLRLVGVNDVYISDCTIEAGISSGLPNEPSSAALSIERARGTIRVSNTRLSAPSSPGSAPLGVRFVRSWGGRLVWSGDNPIRGFTNRILENPQGS